MTSKPGSREDHALSKKHLEVRSGESRLVKDLREMSLRRAARIHEFTEGDGI